MKNISGRELASASFGLTVVESPLKYNAKLFSFNIRTAVSVIPSTQFDTVGSKFSVVPALPEGLILSNDGTISGIPLSVSAPSIYKVTAVNLYTQYVAGLRLEIVPDYAADLVEKSIRDKIELNEFRIQVMKEMHYSDSSSSSVTTHQKQTFTFFYGKRILPELKVVGANSQSLTSQENLNLNPIESSHLDCN